MNEPFNVKVIEYDNGMVEIRKYSRVIGDYNSCTLDVGVELMNARSQRGKKYIKDITEPELIYNPFVDDAEYLQTFEQLEILEQRKKRCEKNSFNRTRQSVYNISRQCKWQYFITLTFAPTVIDRYDFDACMKKANKWFNNQKNRYAEELQYMFVPEQHKDGAWHIHGLIARVGNMSFVDSGKKWGDKVVYNLNGWKNGFSTAVPVGDTDEDVHKVSTYITKYITKSLCDMTKGKRRYYRSKNISEPCETNLFYEPTDFLKQKMYENMVRKLEELSVCSQALFDVYCDIDFDNYISGVVNGLGVELTYEKSVHGFVDVDYKIYN